MQSLFVLGAAAVGMANALNLPRGYYGDNSTSAVTEEYTTSTVYATNVHTVTKCPPEVVDCPVGHVTTETIAVYTTYCPVTAVITVPSGHTKPVEVTKPVETQPVYTKPTESTTEWTTSTVYTTNVHTVTKCPPEVPNCPVGHVTTETVAVSTTVCPVTEEQPKPTEEKPTAPKPTKPVETHPVVVPPPHYGNSTTQYTTSTIYSTTVNTITKCPPEVPNCPVGHTTTETYAVSTTVCPVTETHPAPTKPVETHPVVVPEPSKPVETHPVVVPEPSKPVETHPVVVPEPSKPVETHPVVVPEPSKPVETHPVVVPEPSKPVETYPAPEPTKPVETQPVVVPEPSKPAETHPVVPEPSKPVEPVPTTPTPETPVVTGAAGRMGLDVAAVVAGAAVFLL